MNLDFDKNWPVSRKDEWMRWAQCEIVDLQREAGHKHWTPMTEAEANAAWDATAVIPEDKDIDWKDGPKIAVGSTESAMWRWMLAAREALVVAEAHGKAQAERVQELEAKLLSTQEAIQDDIAGILGALGLPTWARAHSAHEVVQREIVPSARALRAKADALVLRNAECESWQAIPRKVTREEWRKAYGRELSAHSEWCLAHFGLLADEQHDEPSGPGQPGDSFQVNAAGEAVPEDGPLESAWSWFCCRSATGLPWNRADFISGLSRHFPSLTVGPGGVLSGTLTCGHDITDVYLHGDGHMVCQDCEEAEQSKPADPWEAVQYAINDAASSVAASSIIIDTHKLMAILRRHLAPRVTEARFQETMSRVYADGHRNMPGSAIAAAHELGLIAEEPA